MKEISFCAALLLFASSASAEPAALPCSAKGAFGQLFGSGKVMGTVQSEMMNGASFLPPDPLPPFTYFEALTTQRTKKVWGARGVSPLPGKSEAVAFSQRLEGDFRSALSVSEVKKTRLGVTEIYTGTGGFKDTVGGEEKFYHTDGLLIQIEPTEKDVMVTCKDLKLEAKQVEEAMGR